MKISTTAALALCAILMTSLPAEAQDDAVSSGFLLDRNWAPGDSIRMGIGAYLVLFHRDSGWYVWKAGRPTVRSTCFAFKAFEGGRWPLLNELGLLAGGGNAEGFSNAGYRFSESLTYGSEHDWVGGFFGQFGYVKRQVAEVDGVATRDYDEREVVETWDGKKILFEITTGPYEHLYVDNSDQEGVVDFDGLLGALDAFDRCHEAESDLTQSDTTGRGHTGGEARGSAG